MTRRGIWNCNQQALAIISKSFLQGERTSNVLPVYRSAKETSTFVINPGPFCSCAAPTNPKVSKSSPTIKGINRPPHPITSFTPLLTNPFPIAKRMKTNLLQRIWQTDLGFRQIFELHVASNPARHVCRKSSLSQSLTGPHKLYTVTVSPRTCVYINHIV